MNSDITWFYGGAEPPPENVVSHPTGWGDERYYIDKEGVTRFIPARTKMSHPYNYEPIVLLRSEKKGTDNAYTDRMCGWDRDKFYKGLEQKGELRFSWGDKTKVNNFLRVYYDDPTIEVVQVVEYCNEATGYPTWFLGWVTKKGEENV